MTGFGNRCSKMEPKSFCNSELSIKRAILLKCLNSTKMEILYLMDDEIQQLIQKITMNKYVLTLLNITDRLQSTLHGGTFLFPFIILLICPQTISYSNIPILISLAETCQNDHGRYRTLLNDQIDTFWGCVFRPHHNKQQVVLAFSILSSHLLWLQFTRNYQVESDKISRKK